MPFDNDFMNYVGYQIYGGGKDPGYDSFRQNSDSLSRMFDSVKRAERSFKEQSQQRGNDQSEDDEHTTSQYDELVMLDHFFYGSDDDIDKRKYPKRKIGVGKAAEIAIKESDYADYIKNARVKYLPETNRYEVRFQDPYHDQTKCIIDAENGEILETESISWEDEMEEREKMRYSSF